MAGTAASVRWATYLALTAVWALAVAWVVRAHRRDGEPILRPRPSRAATVAAAESAP